MKFSATLNGKTVTKDIPTSWDPVTFRQYIELVDVQGDPNGVLSAFTGIEAETLKRVKIVGLDAILHAISFVNVPPANTKPATILGYKVSKDLEFETTGQFKDAQMVIGSMSLTPETKVLSKEDQLKYLDIVAIFAMPDYLDATAEQQKEFALKFLDAPCSEVLAIGNFTLLKLIGWSLNIRPDSLNRIGPLKRWRLAIQVWVKSMVFQLRYARLKKKLA